MVNRANIHLTFLVVISFILNSCVNISDPVHETSLAIRNNWDEFIKHWENQDASSCAGFYHENGINIPNGFRKNIGREGIEKFYELLFKANGFSKYEHNILSMSVAGDHAIELGEFKVDWFGNENNKWTYHARSLTHWEKDKDGIWKIRTFMFNHPPSTVE